MTEDPRCYAALAVLALVTALAYLAQLRLVGGAFCVVVHVGAAAEARRLRREGRAP